jgi:hypothetical protein
MAIMAARSVWPMLAVTPPRMAADSPGRTKPMSRASSAKTIRGTVR